MEDVGIFCAILIQWSFSGHLVYVSRFGILYREKSGNPVIVHKSFSGRGIESFCYDCTYCELYILNSYSNVTN
jgi:hypothetical protein